MAYKFTIKGIRKLNEEKVVEKALTAFSGIPDESILTMKTYDGIEHKIQIDNLKYHNDNENNESYVL